MFHLQYFTAPQRLIKISQRLFGFKMQTKLVLYKPPPFLCTQPKYCAKTTSEKLVWTAKYSSETIERVILNSKVGKIGKI